MTYTWLLKDSEKNTIEVISFGRNIILENNIPGYKINENRTLTIPYYWPVDRFVYECRLSDGEFFSYKTIKPTEVEGENYSE